MREGGVIVIVRERTGRGRMEKESSRGEEDGG